MKSLEIQDITKIMRVFKQIKILLVQKEKAKIKKMKTL